MNNINYVYRLIKSMAVFGFLTYILLHNNEPLWLMFIVSFLLLTLINILENIFMLLNKKQFASKIHRIFEIVFVAFMFIVLSVWCFILISQKQYSLLIAAIPFFIIGFLIVKNKIIGNKKSVFTFDFNVAFIISVSLIAICFLSGVMILILSLNPLNVALMLFGLFFILGSLVFVFAYMQIKGYFDHLPFDFVGLFMGVVITLVGIGSLFLMYHQNSLSEAKLWILVPIMMIVAGLFQVIKTIKHK